MDELPWMEEWLDSLAIGMANMDEGTWAPFDCFQFFPYGSDLWLEKLGHAERRLQEKGVSYEDLADLFLGPLMLRTEMQFAFFDVKASGIERSKGLGVLDFLHNILKAKCVKDVPGFYSSWVHTEKEIQTIVKHTPWKKGSADIGREIGKLMNSCASLSWSSHSDYHYTNFYENHGPYPIGEHVLLVRQFPNLKPVELWKEAEGYAYDRITIYTMYRKQVEIHLDWVNHLTAKQSLPENLAKYAVNINGKWSDVKHTRKARETIAETAAEQFERFSNLPFEDVKQKMLEMRGYNFKELFEKAGMDWKPSQEMRERVRGKELLPKYMPVLKNAEEGRKWWRRFYDLNDAFFPRQLKTIRYKH
ncbi:hypothetical protein KJ765_01495 [Candidatus Micrarchaeota archaeon]|nr:hypothetical protein [Candidatus Micrarchaeota archaeon]